MAFRVCLDMQGVADQYSPACDMWSVGVILFILLSGYSPFGVPIWQFSNKYRRHRPAHVLSKTSHSMHFADDDVDAVLFRKIKSGKYDADDPIWDSISPSAKDLVVGLHNNRTGILSPLNS